MTRINWGSGKDAYREHRVNCMIGSQFGTVDEEIIISLNGERGEKYSVRLDTFVSKHFLLSPILSDIRLVLHRLRFFFHSLDNFSLDPDIGLGNFLRS